jgi:hypothetical protein
MKISLALGLFLGGGQVFFATDASSSENEIYIVDDEGNYWRPSIMSKSDAKIETARQKSLPLKKRLSTRPDFYQYNKETDCEWQRVYPAPSHELGSIEGDVE